MNYFRIPAPLAVFLATVAPSWAQTSEQDVATTESIAASTSAVESALTGSNGGRWTDAELDELLAPLALYPDPLVALILPAATAPSDVVLAARFLAAQPQSTAFDEQTWDDAVRSLARYPEVIRWMDENLAWTQRLGEAFLQQPADVMNAIQRLRSKAKSSGALMSSPQHTVIDEPGEIRIVPAQPEVIYIPSYDSRVVYVEHVRPSTFISFSIGLPIGYWMAYDCDWRRRSIYVVRAHDRPRIWRECRDLERTVYQVRSPRYHNVHWQVWSAPPSRRPVRHSGFVAASNANYAHRSGGAFSHDSRSRASASRDSVRSETRRDGLPASDVSPTTRWNRSADGALSSRRDQQRPSGGFAGTRGAGEAREDATRNRSPRGGSQSGGSEPAVTFPRRTSLPSETSNPNMDFKRRDGTTGHVVGRSDTDERTRVRTTDDRWNRSDRTPRDSSQVTAAPAVRTAPSARTAAPAVTVPPATTRTQMPSRSSTMRDSTPRMQTSRDASSRSGGERPSRSGDGPRREAIDRGTRQHAD
ncbi:MAG TPA: DUF3300 domain-containing protein [Opitutaceae bacterium]|nr:DUF3300 domain-containing protein [Opitutaceae bacterium]